MITSQIRVLTKSKSVGAEQSATSSSSLPSSSQVQPSTSTKNAPGQPLIPPPDDPLSAFQLKHESEARTFKLIDEKNWNIIGSEPSSETQFFCDGNPQMSVISCIGPIGVGKSSLLNRVALKYAFETHEGVAISSKVSPASKARTIRNLTRGLDVHVTHHRILLDCQPMLCPSVAADFMSGHSGSQFKREFFHLNDPQTCSHMISLQLAAFLIATCDYVVVMSKWLVDSNLLQLIGSALMLLGEGNYKAKLIMFCEDDAVSGRKFRDLTNICLGMNQVDRFFSNERELINYISSYSSEKCNQLDKEPTGLSGRKWLANSRKLWCQTIKDSSLFTDYAQQVQRSNDPIDR